MVTATLQEAKAKLHKLIDAAEAGEQVVLMRGSEVVATILPLHASDLEIVPHLTDRQAVAFWEEIEGKSRKTFSNPSKAVAALKRRKR